MESVNEKLFGNLKTRLAEIDAAEKTGNVERIENLKNSTLKELKDAIAEMEAADALKRARLRIEQQEEKVIEAFWHVCYAIWFWEEAVEFQDEIAADSGIKPDALSEISMNDKTGFDALLNALEPFREAYAKGHGQLDDGVPF